MSQQYQTLANGGAVTVSGVSATTDGLGHYRSIYGVVNVTGVTVGGAGTLDVFLQTSPDGGTTWQDIFCIRMTTISKKLFAISGVAGGVATAITASDGALASNTAVQGPFGDRVRVKYIVTLNGDTGGFTFSVSGVFKGSL